VTVYQPLQTYLNDRQEASVVMSYGEIERLLGRRLPPTAYGKNKRQWWANTETHSQALAWLRANRKAKLNVQREEVAFIKVELETSPKPILETPSFLDGLSASAVRMVEDHAESKQISAAAAAAEFLNEIARRRRAATLDWFAGKSDFSDVTSAELVREDRDAR